MSVLLLMLTGIHHAYGAVIYGTAWRLHVVLVAVPLAGAILLMSASEQRRLRIAAAVLILVFPVLLIGFFEGGYNHLVKNLVFFTSGPARTRALFPAPAYEMPDDYFFEVTGIAQFVLAPFAALEGLKLLHAARAQSAR